MNAEKRSSRVRVLLMLKWKVERESSDQMREFSGICKKIEWLEKMESFWGLSALSTQQPSWAGRKKHVEKTKYKKWNKILLEATRICAAAHGYSTRGKCGHHDCGPQCPRPKIIITIDWMILPTIKFFWLQSLTLSLKSLNVTLGPNVMDKVWCGLGWWGPGYIGSFWWCLGE